MLYAIVGTFWVVSVVGIVYLTSYFHQILKEQTQQSYPVEYFWDAPRLLTFFCLGLAIFYGGMAHQVINLAPLPAFQLMVLHPLPLWPADIWLILAALCLALALLAALFSIDWNGARAQTAPRPSRLDPALERQLAPRALPEPVQTPARQSLALPRLLRGRTRRRWRSQLISVGLVIVFVLIGWQIISRIGLLGSLGRMLANQTLTIVLPERATPTPTPEVGSSAFALFSATHTPQTAPAEQAAPTASAPSAETMQSTSVQSDAASAANGNASTNSAPVATLPLASTPAPPPTATPTPDPARAPHVLIENQYGVNARLEPSLNGAVETVVEPGTQLPVLGQSESAEWIRVQLPSGTEAWVSASVVTMVEPAPLVDEPMEALAASEPTTQPAQPSQAVSEPAASVAQAEPTSPPAQSEVAAASASQDAEQPAAAAAPQRYTITLLNPPDGSATDGTVTLQWTAGFTPAENQALEAVAWRADQSPLRDGVSLGAPVRTEANQEMQTTVDLRQHNLTDGEYRWGVLLVQQEPYQRLAHLSGTHTLQLRGP